MGRRVRPCDDTPGEGRFRRVGVDQGFAIGRGEEIEETILRLD
jgi:hypothetical protein